MPAGPRVWGALRKGGEEKRGAREPLGRSVLRLLQGRGEEKPGPGGFRPAAVVAQSGGGGHTGFTGSEGCLGGRLEMEGSIPFPDVGCQVHWLPSCKEGPIVLEPRV